MLVQLWQQTMSDIMAGGVPDEADEAQDEAQDAEAPDEAGAAAGEAAGGSAGSKRKSERISSSGKQDLSGCAGVEDWCEIRKQSGGLSVPSSVQGICYQGSFCWEGCTGQWGGGGTNAVPDIDSAQWVQVSTAMGGCYGKYLTATKRIAIGTMFTIFGGVTVKRHTHLLAYEMFTKLHAQQSKAEGEPKFQYSTQTGTKLMKDSLAWLIPPQDLALLQALMTGSRFSNTQLKTLVQEQTEAQGLGQYAQHTCCPVHVNAHLFPMFMLGADVGDEELWELRGVALRAERLIKKGEEILIHYVGSGRSFNFSEVFKCTCCVCMGRCPKPL